MNGSGNLSVFVTYSSFFNCSSDYVTNTRKNKASQGGNVWIDCMNTSWFLQGDKQESRWEGTISSEMEWEEENKFWVREMALNGGVIRQGSLLSFLFPSTSFTDTNSKSVTTTICLVLLAFAVILVVISYILYVRIKRGSSRSTVKQYDMNASLLNAPQDFAVSLSMEEISVNGMEEENGGTENMQTVLTKTEPQLDTLSTTDCIDVTVSSYPEHEFAEPSDSSSALMELQNSSVQIPSIITLHLSPLQILIDTPLPNTLVPQDSIIIFL